MYVLVTMCHNIMTLVAFALHVRRDSFFFWRTTVCNIISIYHGDRFALDHLDCHTMALGMAGHIDETFGSFILWLQPQAKTIPKLQYCIPKLSLMLIVLGYSH